VDKPKPKLWAELPDFVKGNRTEQMHAIFSFDPEANGTLLSLAHGYVVEHGKIFGLKDAHGRTKRRERYAETVDLDQIKRHYYMTHARLNPLRIVAASNGPDLSAPHGRG